MHTRNLHTRVLNKLLLILVSIICPGVAHFFLGQYVKASVILGSYVLHVLFTISISTHQLLQKPLTIAVLFIAACVHYFYSIFDGLQQYEKKNQRSKQSIRLKMAAIIMLIWGVLVVSSLFNEVLATWLVAFYPYTFIMFSILYLVTHLKSEHTQSLYLGRTTAIIYLSFIVVAGITYDMLWLQLQLSIVVINILALMVFECSIFYLLKRLNLLQSSRLTMDAVSIIAIIVITAAFIYVPKYGHLPSELLKSFHNLDRTQYSYDIAQQTRRNLEPISISATEEHSDIIINHRNGLVKIQAYAGDYIKIEPFIYDVSQAEFQARIDEINRIDIALQDEHIFINTVVAEHDEQVSKMDIIISVPLSLSMDSIRLNMEYGKVQLERVKQFKSIVINGNDVNVNSLNSSGNIDVKLAQGNSYIFKQNGTATVNTTSGHILLYNILREINAVTLNGNIVINADVLNESITAHAGVGSVQISIPSIIEYGLIAESSFGEIVIFDEKQQNPILLNTFNAYKQLTLYADQNIVIH